jgi:hypothetical protein
VANNPLDSVDPTGLYEEAPAPAPYSFMSGNCAVFVTFTWSDGGWLPNYASMCGGAASAVGGSVGGSSRKNAPQEIGTPKTSSQCSIYFRDSSSSGQALYTLCSNVFPDNPFSQRMRGCLQSMYIPGPGYMFVPVLTATLGPGMTDLDSIIPGTGAHLACLANSIGLF